MKNTSTSLLLSLAAFFCCCLLVFEPSRAQNNPTAQTDVETTQLFELTGAQKSHSSVSIAALREQQIIVNFEKPNLETAAVVRFTLLDGKVYEATRHDPEGFVRFAEDEYSWHGRILGDNDWSGDVILTVKGRALSGLIYSPQGVYEIVPQENFNHLLVEIDQSRFPACAGALPAKPDWQTGLEVSPSASPFDITADNGSQLDVLVVYTAPVRSALGGTTQTEAFIQQAVSATNTAYQNSDINPRLRLVNTQEVSYLEDGTLSSALEWVDSDATVATARNLAKADLVAIIIENASDGCGLGYVMRSVGSGFSGSAFSATARGCAVGNLSFAHELGHNQGCEHNPENGGSSGSASYPYAFGHYVNGLFRTVMSYADPCSSGCTRKPYFSNPAVSFGGSPTGIANQRDNHRVINNTALIVSQFRESGGGGGSCTYSVSPTSRSFSASSTSSSVDVITGSTCSWTATVNAPSSDQLLSIPEGSVPLPSLLSNRTTMAPEAPQSVFLNSSPIAINDRSSNTGPPAPGSLYPSTINVSGMTGTITSVQATLNGVSHVFPDDIDVVLVGPGGQRAILMSDVGGASDLAGVDLIFEQSAAAMPDETQLVSGTYRPTNFNTNTSLEPGGVDNFPSPGPGQSSYGSDLSVFNGTSPNGAWKIYVVDDEHLDAGNIANGWALGIVTSSGTTSWINITSGSSGTGNGTINYSVAANPGQSQRTGTITVNGQTHTITQAGSSGTCPSTSISPGQTKNGTLTTADCIFVGTTRYVDVYNFSGTAGQQIVLSMGSSTFDTYLYLLNASNQLLSQDDDGGGGTDSRIPTTSGLFTLPASGSYTIYATSFSSDGITGSTGPYTLTLSSGTRAKTVGVFRPSNGIVYLKNSNSGGVADLNFVYGVAGDKPIAGDWDGNGVDTLGIYRNGTFYLRNSNSTGAANIVFPFGASGDLPIAGDWNGDGVDTVGVYRPTTGVFFLRNSNSAGAADVSFVLGNPGDVPIAGDWNADGITTTGVFRPSNGIVYLKNANSSGIADIYLVYGNAGDLPLAGDWNGDAISSVGIYRNGVFYLRNLNTQGVADLVFAMGNNGDVPIAGDWDGLP